MGFTFSHIINPYRADVGTTAHRIQQITLHSIHNAVAYCPSVSVQLLTEQFAEDAIMVPNAFVKTPHLEQSVLDAHTFSQPKKYAFIHDVLERAYDASDAEFIIYTNMDIIVQPIFYTALAAYLAEGLDALVVNRRRIADTGQTEGDLPLILAQIGRSHPGFDCFVIHRSLIPKMKLTDVCVGVPFVEATLVHNIIAFANNYRIVTDAHLTTHLGLEVMPPRDAEYHSYNQQCFNAILPQLKPLMVGKKLPYAYLTFVERTWKRALNPALFSGLSLELEGKNVLQKVQGYWNELRFYWLEKN